MGCTSSLFFTETRTLKLNSRRPDYSIRNFPNVAASISQLPFLRYLDLDAVHLGDSGVKALVTAFHSILSLTVLKMYWVPFGSAGLAALSSSSGLPILHNLKRLYLGGALNDTEADLSPLLSRLPSSLEFLNLLGNPLDRTASAIAPSLGSLRFLALDRCYVSEDRDLILLSESWSSRPPLDILSLGENRLDLESAIALYFLVVLCFILFFLMILPLHSIAFCI